MVISNTGYGAGENPGTGDRPNLLRLILGEFSMVEEKQQVEVIETHLDDWNPEGFPLLSSRLFEKHALDVSLMPIQMKKGRPGFCLSVIADPGNSLAVKELILSETSAIGLRYRQEQRFTLPREKVAVETRWGTIEAKKVHTPVGPRIYPEYEACRLVAEQYGLPLDTVYREIIARTEGQE